MRWSIWYLAAINFLDYLTTKVLIDRQGFQVESNPWLRAWMESAHATWPMLVAKFIPMLVFVYALKLMRDNHPERYAHPTWKWIVLGLNIAFTVVVVTSLYAIIFL